MATNPLELKRLSDEARCVDINDMAKLTGQTKVHAQVWHDTLGRLGKKKQAFARVLHRGREWLADVVTGSLYDAKTLCCASSDKLSLRLC